MPRGPRLDAPGAIHHVMIRGVEKRTIFLDDRDCESFTERLDRLIPELGFTCFAWALMPNHAHLVLETGPVPLARLMARLGTGYAGYFNRRHDRAGHLIQNRYRTRPVVDDADLLGLVVYVNLNPLAGGIVPDLDALGTFLWCGHSALIGSAPARPFEAVGRTLALVSTDASAARAQILEWMRLRADLPEPPGLPETGARDASLGPPAPEPEPQCRRPGAVPTLPCLVEEVLSAHGLTRTALEGASRARRLVRARDEIATRASRDLGLSGRAIAEALGVSESTISRALSRRAVTAGSRTTQSARTVPARPARRSGCGA